MLTVKLVDTDFKKVIIEHANPQTENISGFVGGNDVVVGGKRVIKHYRFKVGKAVELPVTFIKQLEERKVVLSVATPTTKAKTANIYNIKEVKETGKNPATKTEAK